MALSNAWDVLMLFLIPVGGGIPAGVLLAKTRSIDWPITMLIYLISDVILACVFEPILLLIIAAAKRSPKIEKFRAVMKQTMAKTTAGYGSHLGPLALIMVAFGVDPMTGRAVAVAAGHGFVTGWMLAITGDMLYFTLIMACTLWLSKYLGDGTWTTLIILALMMGVPVIVRRVREKRAAAKAQPS